jgi:hypothetical protein
VAHESWHQATKKLTPIHNQECISRTSETIPVGVAPEILKELARIHNKLYRGLRTKYLLARPSVPVPDKLSQSCSWLAIFAHSLLTMTRLTPSFVGDIVLGVVGGRMTGRLVVFRSLRPVHFAR